MSKSPTRTTIFGLFVVTGRKLAASQVIALAHPLAISASNVKSHLTRMVKEGVLRRSGPVRLSYYWPSDNQSGVVEGIRARLQLPVTEVWHGDWLMLTLPAPARRTTREHLKSALWFDGFRPWTSDTWIRPAWPAHRALQRANTYLEQFGGLCMQGRLLKPPDMKQIARIYQLDALDREARKLAQWIRTQRVPHLPSKAFAERLQVGGLVARLAGHDPHLPAALWNGRTGMREMVQEFRRFEIRMDTRAQRFVDEILAKSPARLES